MHSLKHIKGLQFHYTYLVWLRQTTKTKYTYDKAWQKQLMLSANSNDDFHNKTVQTKQNQ